MALVTQAAQEGQEVDEVDEGLGAAASRMLGVARARSMHPAGSGRARPCLEAVDAP